MKITAGLKRILFTGLALMLFAASAAAFARVPVPAAADTGKTVRVGYFSEAGMMNGAKEGAAKSGYVYEYLQEIASSAGWRYDYVYGSFSELYQELLAGRIDVLPYITKTEERTHEVLFPDRQMGDEKFYIASMRPGRLSAGLSELEGKKVGTTRDAFQNIPFRKLVSEKNINCELVEFRGPDERWIALKNGEIDFTIETDTIFQSVDLHAVYDFDDRYPYYLIVSWDRTDLLDELNRAQEHLEKTNPSFLQTLKQKYFKGIPIYRELTDEGRAWLETHDSIRIGTYDKDEPYVIENADGTITGIAPDYISFMLKELEVDIPVEWKFYDGKQSALEALRAGRIDLVNPYYHDYNDAEADGIIISNEVYSSDMSILYEGEYNADTLSVIATPDTRLGASYVRDNYPDSTIIPCLNGYACIDRLRAGDATCVILYTDALNYIAKKYRKNYHVKSLNARCPVCFAALPGDAALISVINKAAPFVTDVEMNRIQDRYSVEKSEEVTPVAFFKSHPEYIFGAIAVALAVALFIAIMNVKKEKALSAKERENELYRNVINQFAADFEAVIIGNIDNNTFKLASKGRDGKISISEGPGLLTTVFEQYVRQDLHPLDRERIDRELIQTPELKARVAIGESHSIEYRRNTSGEYLWYRATLNRINESEIVIGFKECDVEKRSHIVTEKLMDEYDALYIADLNRDIIIPERSSRVSYVGAFRDRRKYSEMVEKFAGTVAERNRQEWLNFSNPAYMKMYMVSDDHREYVYELPETERKMRRMCVDVIERENGEAAVVLLSFMGIDDARAQAIAIQRKMAEQKVLLDYFIKSFTSAYMINLAENTFEIVYMNHQFSDSFSMNGPDTGAMEKFIEEHVHHDDREMMLQMTDREYVKDRLRKEDSYTFTVREIFGSSVKTMRGLTIRVADEEHAAFGFVDISEEVREQKEKEEQLQQALSMAQSASRAKTIFLNSMSHDIRTPMNAIIGFTELAATHLDNTDQVRDYLGKIGQASEHLLSLINDVLDMSRIESGKMHLEDKPEKLSDIVHTLKNIVQADIDARHHELFIDMVGVTDDDIFCDRLRLSQVLLNVLSNSIKYTAENGIISMRVTEREGLSPGFAVYEFCIKDNGMGMDEEYLKTIFDPFTRVKSSTVSGIQGTGLGMAITKNLVDMMGGRIDVKSEPERGTQTVIAFEFRMQEEQDGEGTIPDAGSRIELVGEDEDAANEPGTDSSSYGRPKARTEQPAEEAPARTGDELAGKRILLVEDNELNQEIATDILGECGCIVDIAMDGNIAVEIMRNAKPGYYDLILMDIQMPTMDGYEATRQIRALQSPVADIPILAMTANAFAEDRQMALEAGMNDHISKPIRIDKLKEILAHFL